MKGKKLIFEEQKDTIKVDELTINHFVIIFNKIVNFPYAVACIKVNYAPGKRNSYYLIDYENLTGLGTNIFNDILLKYPTKNYDYIVYEKPE